MSRWVRVQSDILDHPLFANAERSESDAWLWLIANAAWSPTHHRIGNDIVPVPVGSVFVTLRGLAKEWNWKSEKRVRTFLRVLENHEMIVTKTDAGKTQITICNYSKYQESGRTQDAERTQDGRTKYTNTPNTSSLRSDVDAQARSTPKQDFVSELSELLDAETIEAIIDHRKKKRAPITAKAGKLMANELRRCANPREAADMMILHGWQGIKAEWVENRKVNHRKEPPPKPMTHTDVWANALREKGILPDEPDSHEPDLLDAGDRHGYREGNVHPLRLAGTRAY